MKLHFYHVSLSISLLFLLISSSAQAQEDGSNRKFSLEYGAFSTRISDRPLTALGKFGQSLTFRMHQIINKDVELTYGIGYLQSGERVAITNDPIYIRVEESYTNRFAYLPIGVYLPSKDFYVHPEIMLFYNVSNRQRIELTELILSDDPEEDPTTDITIQEGPTELSEGSFSQFSVALSISAGVRIPLLDKYEVNVGVRYFFGVTQLITDIPRDYRHTGVGLTTAFIF